VDKYVFAACALDKSIAFSGVKPFHYTLFSHYWYLLFHSRVSLGRSFPAVPAPRLGKSRKTFATVKLPAIVARVLFICKRKTRCNSRKTTALPKPAESTGKRPKISLLILNVQ
jgi:hypothetical protein